MFQRFANATETTPCPSTPSTTSISQFLLYGALTGLTIMAGLTGLFAVTTRWWFSEKKPAAYWMVSIAMTIFNVFAIVFSVFFTFTFILGPENCVIGYLLTNLSSQLFFLAFDIFLCLKTSAVCQFNKPALGILTLTILNRVFWAIFDLTQSFGVYDSAEGCIYQQNALTGIGYNAADIICDAFCTVISLGANWRIVKSNFSEIARVLVQENVLRSFLILTMNSVMIYVSAHDSDPFTLTIAYFVQNAIYAIMLNSELLWMDVRKQVHSRQMISHQVNEPSNPSKKAPTDKSVHSGNSATNIRNSSRDVARESGTSRK
ncbi:hypothetical protein BC830DRAFT_1104533 [Chytriomyces sp. MP71]|nr:hypothetical protein BC830DRAFT_1104533 [Chytriomyces sp. MP71]